MENNDILLEPCDAYNKVYKESFAKNAGEAFDELVKKSGIDVELNRRLSAEYRASNEETNRLKSKLSSRKTVRVILIIIAIIAALLLIYGIYDSSLPFIIAPPVVAAAALIFIFVKLNKAIKSFESSFEESDAKTKELYKKATESINALWDLFSSSTTRELVTKTVPTLLFDRNFDMRRYDYLSGKYGLPADYGSETSVSDVLSGEIIGNPFIFEKQIIHVWGTQIYHGSLTIHWTTTEIVDGKRVTRHHTQVLHASVTKPKPFFPNHTRLIYGNEAAPDLSFSRQASHAERLSERKLDSYVKSKAKEIRKLAKNNMDKGFTELGNEQFDSLFWAIDRDHEVQFRLLFTPLAQKNLLRIMKGESPYGDDFSMQKNKCINIISSEHLQSWRFNIDVSEYFIYDVDMCKDKFLSLNSEYFKSVFFDFAPLLSIPLYQQYKPKEYIYKDGYQRNYTVREAETMANAIGGALLHPASVTPAIIKTELIGTHGDVDTVLAHALSYRTVSRVDFVPVLGGDGYWHNVPVPWLLYIPLEQETEFEMKQLNMTDREYRYSDYAKDGESHRFYHSIFATLGTVRASVDSSPDEVDEDIEKYGGVKETE